MDTEQSETSPSLSPVVSPASTVSLHSPVLFSLSPSLSIQSFQGEQLPLLCGEAVHSNEGIRGSYTLSARRSKLLGKLHENCADSPTVVIDCNFEPYQTDKELSRLVQQLMYSYGANCAAERPVKMAITGIGPRLCQSCDRISGWKQWLCDLYQEDYTLIYPPSSVVYLTADSEQVLESLDKDKVYVIGGLVDRNRHKDLCRSRAHASQLSTARFPIKEHMTLNGTKVLTVNQVLSILHKFLLCNDWKTALLDVVPSRKITMSSRQRKLREKRNSALQEITCNK
ncbi:tRna (guanine(9)-N(1))-methyltransferase [Cardiosporidium cionae]|uniref:tRNA (guanine(9)-N(1))-methyltransferase n=1 Tax=Cardiosporidium cionae TaxID=476202 RepID=A0ABQ7JCR4_9APIC|nr:tRna (guanine(9)-N(1))-methyltransferase [Cardiosporidium cionae]|eukprot:KAF8821807.1 tRna (guanine(9)-N(1))-methyltransferase [Cardiosporidium cionae]